MSFHANAGGGDGFEAYYYGTSAKGKKLAELCEKHVKTLGQNIRTNRRGDHLYFVRNTSMPAVLVESFFVDNAADKKIGDTTDEQKAFGVVYAKAILEYLGIKYKPKQTTTYRVQVGAYNTKMNADAMRDKLKRAGYEAIIVKE